MQKYPVHSKVKCTMSGIQSKVPRYTKKQGMPSIMEREINQSKQSINNKDDIITIQGSGGCWVEGGKRVNIRTTVIA